MMINNISVLHVVEIYRVACLGGVTDIHMDMYCTQYKKGT